ncbi:MAG: phage tail protein [Betaproteobacteria bacterium]|nr:phage tail protein [Betaproteobacteria bacterium]
MDMSLPIIETPRPSLVYSPHPLLAGAGRRMEFASFLPGESISAYLERVGILLGNRPVFLCLNDRQIHRDAWGETFPATGDMLTMRARVRDGGGGGGGGGKNPLRTVLSIAVMVMAPGLGSMMSGATGFGAFSMFGQTLNIWSGVIAIGGNLLINALLPPPTPTLAQAQQRGYDQPSPTYALSGGSNRARPFEPPPLVLGTHIIFPDAGAKTYTEFEGDDQYLYQIFHFGLSDVVLSDFRIGNTPIANFSGVEIQESGPDGALTLFPANVDTTSGGDLTAAIGWIQRTSSISATALGVDVGGQLYYAGDSGMVERSATIEIEYRAVGAATWLPFVGSASAVVLTNASTKPLRLTYRLTVAQGQYEVRVRRTTPDETDSRAVSSLTWAQLRTYQPDASDYTGQKRVALRIKASGQLQGQVEQFSAIAAASCPVWTGTAWVTQVTSNPAWWLLWWLRGKRLNNRRMYGACLPDGRIDIEAIKDFATWCASKSLTIDCVIDRQQAVKEVADSIARCGRGFTTVATGKHGVIWDAENLPVTQVFGMGNIRRRSFQVEYVTGNLADEVVVNFINPDLDWQQDTVRALVPGVTQPERTVTLDLFGCKYTDMAGRAANLMAAEQKYHLRRVTWESDFEGMVVHRGDVVALSHDLTQWGYSGRLMGGTSTELVLDRKVPFTPGTTHYVRIEFPNGYFNIFEVVYQAGESDTITLTAPLPTVDESGTITLYTPDADPDHPPYDFKYGFDVLATPGKKLKIANVQPLSENHVKLTAIDEEAEYYARESDPYTYVAPATYSRLVPTLSELSVSEKLLSASSGAVSCRIGWKLASATGADVSVIVNGRDTHTARVTGSSVDFTFTVGDVLAITARPYGLAQLTSSSVTMNYLVEGKVTPPPDVTGFSVAQNGDMVLFRCDVVQGVEAVEVRRAPLGSSDWATAAPTGEITGNIMSTPVPPGAWNFLAKARDTSQNRSTNAIAVALTVENGHDIIQQTELGPLWLGCTLTHFFQHWTGVLIPQGQAAVSTQGWETFEPFSPDPYPDCYVEAPEVDLLFDCAVRLWGNSAPGSAGLSLEVDWKLAAGAYGGWRPWTVGDVNARYAKFRLHLNTLLGQSSISAFQTTADALEFPQSGALTIAAGGTAITFPTPYHFAPGLAVKNTGGTALIPGYTGLTPTGATLHLYDLTGASAGGSGGWDSSGV